MSASSHLYPDHPRVGVGVFVWHPDGRLLLIRRGNPPLKGEWCVPGGSQELGEPLFATAEREVAEETGITCRATGILTVVDGITRDEGGPGDGLGRVRFHYTIVEVDADYLAGEPRPGDDAEQALWADRAECARLVTWPAMRAVVDLAWRRRFECGLDG